MPGSIERSFTARPRRGLAWVEIVAVVLLLSILLVVLVFNNETFQTRAKVARAMTRMRAIAAGAEAYMAAHGRLPDESAFASPVGDMKPGLIALTTPVAYLAIRSEEDVIDPFSSGIGGEPEYREYFEIVYADEFTSWTKMFYRLGDSDTYQDPPNDSYLIESYGPDRRDDMNSGAWGPDLLQDMGPSSRWFFSQYDPSNGLVSRGNPYIAGGRLPMWFVEEGLPRSSPQGYAPHNPPR